MAAAAGPKGVKEDVEEDAAELQFPPGKLRQNKSRLLGWSF
jgi:hypothetical protein